MSEREDKNTRYFIDLDLQTNKILGWSYAQKKGLQQRNFTNSFQHRVFITKGQYNKLINQNIQI